MRISKFPIKFDELSINETITYCLQKGSYRYIVTPNVDHMCRIYKEPEMFELYSTSDLCVCDSKVLQYISILLMDKSIRNIVRGSDLVVRLLKTIPSSCPILVIGDSDKFKPDIEKQYNLSAVDVYTPPMGFINKPDNVKAALDYIIASNADIIFLAVGSPQQEILARYLRNRVDHGVAICCGNAVNFAVGKVKRAPRWMSAVGIEWLHRVLSEPNRMIGRYLKNLEIFLLMFQHKIENKR